MKIKQLCASERPREKMIEKGANVLSNAELLAILLRSGNSQMSAIELAHELLGSCDGNLAQVYNLGLEKLCSRKGVGSGKACSILAAFELGRRFVCEESAVEKKPIVSARSVYEMMRPNLKALKHEEFWILLLNESNYLIRKIKATSGGGNSTVIDVRQVLLHAINCSASGIILVHNHPSGNPRPSDADVRQTKLMKKAADNCGLSLMDHVIICDDSFFSFETDMVCR